MTKSGPTAGDINNRETTGDPWLDLLGAVLRLAVRDAKRGDGVAVDFLFWIAPGWAEAAIDGEAVRAKQKRRRRHVVSPQEAPSRAKRRPAIQIDSVSASRGLQGVDNRFDREGYKNMSYEHELSKGARVVSHVSAQSDKLRRAGMTPEQQAAEDSELAAFRAAGVAAEAARRQAKADALEAADQERRQQLEERAKADARRAWAGDAAAFERQWPAMYEQMLAKQTLERMESGRAAQRELYSGAF